MQDLRTGCLLRLAVVYWIAHQLQALLPTPAPTYDPLASIGGRRPNEG